MRKDKIIKEEKFLPKKIKKTVIIVGYSCNNNCLFCVYANKRNSFNKKTTQIEEEIIQARKRGATYLEFIGGEMTIRPDFLYLVSLASRLGFETITMATNGRVLSYEDFARKLIKAGLTNIIFSLHGHNAEIHDYLTQVPGSFNQLMKGFNNVKKFLGIKNIGSNTTIVKKNYQYLPQIGELILRLGVRNSEFIFVDCNEGGARNSFEELVPRISEAAIFIRHCLSLGKRKKVPHWHIRYVPLCYFNDYLDQISELFEREHFHTEHLGPDFINLNVEESRPRVGRLKPDKCKFCELYDRCEGIWKNYFYHYGDEELKPVLKQ